MSSKKVKVVYIKRVEDRDKQGRKTVIEAGTKAEMTPPQAKKAQHVVRVLKEDQPASQPAKVSGQPPAVGGDGDGTGDGDEGGEGDGTGAGEEGDGATGD
ncbi:hypothetical protein [Marinobacter pelagius]|uniref:Uncharacterized protein n=1 Tax=Marinobacter pelagius TaxID=379482 RepID=A0A1I4T423_9GAMM|nr:hypothetical protein [Marinobacter pelagius]SFM71419.1 hypothetical protein SAMN04487961_0988 [Marinobacter pelagius]